MVASSVLVISGNPRPVPTTIRPPDRPTSGQSSPPSLSTTVATTIAAPRSIVSARPLILLPAYLPPIRQSLTAILVPNCNVASLNEQGENGMVSKRLATEVGTILLPLG
ncbi:MAG TPA: hypothetical protein VMU81_12490 [Acetobacteraceae bacterium]|nr:hypothetical protein [Acetobacteraceae bacterium]